MSSNYGAGSGGYPASGGYGSKGGGGFGGNQPMSYGNNPYGGIYGGMGGYGGYGGLFGGGMPTAAQGAPAQAAPPMPMGLTQTSAPTPLPAATAPAPPQMPQPAPPVSAPGADYSLSAGHPLPPNGNMSQGVMQHAPVATPNASFFASQPSYVNAAPATAGHGMQAGWNSGFQPTTMPFGLGLQTQGNQWRFVPQAYAGGLRGRHGY